MDVSQNVDIACLLKVKHHRKAAADLDSGQVEKHDVMAAGAECDPAPGGNGNAVDLEHSHHPVFMFVRVQLGAAAAGQRNAD